MQEKCKKQLELLFPVCIIRYGVGEFKNQLRFNKSSIENEDFENLKQVEGMYKDISIKRSGTGLVIIIKF